MAMLDMPTVTTGLAPESPPVPRFCKSKVKRNNTVESGSQESATTASPESCAGTFFMYSSSDDERSEPDVHTGLPKGLLRAPPGLSNVSNLAQAPMTVNMAASGQPGMWSANQQISPELPDTPPGLSSEILRRVQELEAVKAQLKAAEYMAMASAQPFPNLEVGGGSHNPAQLSTGGMIASNPFLLEELRLTGGLQQFQCSPFLSTSVGGARYQAPAMMAPSHSMPAAGLEHPAPAPCNPQVLETMPRDSPVAPASLRREAFETPAEFAVQKAINQELLAASAGEDEQCVFQVLEVAAKYLKQMNGVNLSTAIHRIARACQRFKHMADQVKKAPAFMSMVEAAERMVLQELEHRDLRMPVKCCTIIAWSCASLRVFRNSLFKALARLATVNLELCQSYEMTNIMWAFGELCKSRRQLGKDIKEDLEQLLEATCRVFASRPFGAWKLQVLMSALVSLTILPWQPSSQRLFTDIAMEVAQRHVELANEKTKPLTMAFNELRNKKSQVFREIVPALQQHFPDFVACYAGANRM